jgi:hypothetical protein
MDMDAFRTEMRGEFGQIDGRFGHIDGRFDKIEGEFRKRRPHADRRAGQPRLDDRGGGAGARGGAPGLTTTSLRRSGDLSDFGQ